MPPLVSNLNKTTSLEPLGGCPGPAPTSAARAELRQCDTAGRGSGDWWPAPWGSESPPAGTSPAHAQYY